MSNTQNRPVQLVSSPSATSHEDETVLLEEKLLEDILKLVHRFVTRSGRSYDYDANMEWNIYSDGDLSFNVTVKMSPR